MPRSLVVRAAALFVLSLLLVAPWSAAEPRQQDHGPASVPLLGQLLGRLTALWADIGCGIDPDGRCHDSATSQADIGCVADPNGGCHY